MPYGGKHWCHSLPTSARLGSSACSQWRARSLGTVALQHWGRRSDFREDFPAGKEGSEQTQEEESHFSGQCMCGKGEKGEAVLCWGRAKTQERRNPLGQGWLEPEDSQGRAVCLSLGRRTPWPRHWLPRGPPLLLSAQPLRGPPLCPARPPQLLASLQTGWDRVDRQSHSLSSRPAPLPLQDAAPPSPGPPR